MILQADIIEILTGISRMCIGVKYISQLLYYQIITPFLKQKLQIVTFVYLSYLT